TPSLLIEHTLLIATRVSGTASMVCTTPCRSAEAAGSAKVWGGTVTTAGSAIVSSHSARPAYSSRVVSSAPLVNLSFCASLTSPAFSSDATLAAMSLPRNVPPTSSTLACSRPATSAITFASPSGHAPGAFRTNTFSAPRRMKVSASPALVVIAPSGNRIAALSSSPAVSNCRATASSSEKTNIPAMFLSPLAQAFFFETSHQLGDLSRGVAIFVDHVLASHHKSFDRNADDLRRQVLGRQTKAGDLDFLRRLLGGRQHLFQAGDPGLVDFSQHADHRRSLHRRHLGTVGQLAGCGKAIPAGADLLHIGDRRQIQQRSDAGRNLLVIRIGTSLPAQNQVVLPDLADGGRQYVGDHVCIGLFRGGVPHPEHLVGSARQHVFEGLFNGGSTVGE